MASIFGSLFAGIGGLDLALETYGWYPAWQVERDDYCRKILDMHWPDVRRYGDIREIDWRSVEPVELVCGGFPCQPFSVAGQNRGEYDDRNMWPETYRAIRELGPRYVFLENVPGLLAHGYFGRILGDLAESGYDAVWDTFTAAEVGAPHRRERLFILAYARHDGGDERGEPTGGSAWGSRSESSSQGSGLAHTRRGDHERRGGPGAVGRAARPGEGDGTERERLRPTSPDRGAALANGGCESEQLRERREGDESPRGGVELGGPEGDTGAWWAESAGRAGTALSGRSGTTLADAEGQREREPHDQERSQPRGGAWGYVGRGGWQFPPGPDDRDAWARLLAEVPALEPAVCRVATGVPDRTHRLRALGNAVVPAQGAYALRSLWARMLAV